MSLHDEANAEHLALVKGWLEHAKTVYIWDGAFTTSINNRRF